MTLHGEVPSPSLYSFVQGFHDETDGNWFARRREHHGWCRFRWKNETVLVDQFSVVSEKKKTQIEPK